ncbi:MAG: DEAD/DEAH box helicase family protein, partial [Gammaproteobacteria bacterium]|nr:DEAD/DEAH box helicase family protein [Gammaproteobacteria bacterium]
MTEVLGDAVKQEIQEAYRAWLKARGFKPRRGQREMIAHVARMLASRGNRLGVVEAGTGTGKTAAYCIAAIPLAKALNKRVVISSATVALQEQVTLRDLPDLKANANLDFTFTLAKGRGRYVCLKRLEERLTYQNQEQTPLFAEPEPDHVRIYERMQVRYGEGDWNGELDSWDDGVDSEVWSAVTTDHRGCSNNRCSFIHQCPFFQARASVDDADVIVANHDLVLADLALGGGVVLPAPEDTIFIFDEAHHLPDKTRQHFTARARLRATTQWLDQLNASVGTMTQRFSRPAELLDLAKHLVDETAMMARLVAEVETMVSDLDFARVDDTRENHRFALGRVPEALADVCEPLAGYFTTVADRLETLHGQVSEVLDGERDWPNAHQAEDWLPVVGQLAARALASQALFADYA